MNKRMVLIGLIVVFVGCFYRSKFELHSNSLYKIVPVDNYDPNNTLDCVKLLRLDLESGFIHVAYGKQVNGIMKKFFSHYDRILVLELDSQVLNNNGTILKLEANKPGGEIFPHLYGIQKILLKAIVKTILFEKNELGEFVPDSSNTN